MKIYKRLYELSKKEGLKNKIKKLGYISIYQFAKNIEMSPRHIYRLIEEGWLPFKVVDNRYMIDGEKLVHHLNNLKKFSTYLKRQNINLGLSPKGVKRLMRYYDLEDFEELIALDVMIERFTEEKKMKKEEIKKIKKEIRMIDKLIKEMEKDMLRILKRKKLKKHSENSLQEYNTTS